MSNLFEYIIVFLGLVLFLPNNLISTITIGISVITIVSYFLLYILTKKKDPSYKEDTRIDKTIVLATILVLALNIIEKFEYINLIFLAGLTIFFILKIVLLVLKKEYIFKKRILNMKYVFDIYTYTYLVMILIKLLSFEI